MSELKVAGVTLARSSKLQFNLALWACPAKAFCATVMSKKRPNWPQSPPSPSRATGGPNLKLQYHADLVAEQFPGPATAINVHNSPSFFVCNFAGVSAAAVLAAVLARNERGKSCWSYKLQGAASCKLLECQVAWILICWLLSPVEGTRLEIERRLNTYRGFESHPFRHIFLINRGL